MGVLAKTANRSIRAQGLSWRDRIEPQFAEIEAQCGGRLGVGILDTKTGHLAGHRGKDRFPMCSTHKALGAAAILSLVDQGKEQLDRRIRYHAEDILPYSPATQGHADGGGMTLGAICEAAVTLSDNTAANLILGAIGGPAGLTRYLRGLGDEVSRLDRTEPTLNQAIPGDPRDTTSPFAMAEDLNRLMLGNALSAPSRERLAGWLVAGRTGDTRLRAGIPPGWRIGEKTGTGDHGTANDIGVVWPPNGTPAIITVFITGSTVTLEAQSAAIAEVAKVVARSLAI